MQQQIFRIKKLEIVQKTLESEQTKVKLLQMLLLLKN